MYVCIYVFVCVGLFVCVFVFVFVCVCYIHIRQTTNIENTRFAYPY